MTTIYKICTAAEWRDAERAGAYRGSALTGSDGFIHFSTAEQAAETAAKHFAGQHDLVLVSVDAAARRRLKWEPSRGGALFPHLYGDLTLAAVLRVDPLPLDAAGRHVFPRMSRARITAINRPLTHECGKNCPWGRCSRMSVAFRVASIFIGHQRRTPQIRCPM